jgi:hypothetical protein
VRRELGGQGCADTTARQAAHYSDPRGFATQVRSTTHKSCTAERCGRSARVYAGCSWRTGCAGGAMSGARQVEGGPDGRHPTVGEIERK